MSILPGDFDQNPWLLNVRNGTLDLRSGQLLPHDPNDLHSRLSRVVFDPTAKCLLFERFIGDVFDDNVEMIACMGRAFGSSLTGITRDQVFFALHGVGSNGKSTMVKMLGDYAHEFDPELLMAGEGEPRFETAHLMGIRLAVTSGSSATRSLNKGKIRRWTGNEQLTGEFKFKDSFTFWPKFKLFFNTNHLPRIQGVNNGIWRRVSPIPFEQTFWDPGKNEDGADNRRADLELKDKLEGESSGILNWLLAGCLRWQSEDSCQNPQTQPKAQETVHGLPGET